MKKLIACGSALLSAAMICGCAGAHSGGTLERDEGFRFWERFSKKPTKPADEAFGFVDLACRHAKARVSLFGAQVVSFVPTGRAEVLFVPKSLPFSGMGEVHGGIPICWPSFSFDTADAGLPQHGFARYSPFRAENRRTAEDYDEVTLVLESNEETLRMWPHEFRLEVKVQLTDRLRVSVKTVNVGKAPLELTEAMHAYFRVADVKRCAVRGLVADPKDEGWASACVFRPTGGCSGTFGAWRPDLVLEDDVEKRAVGLSMTGNNSVVLWNPGDYGKRKENLGVGEWDKFLCVEPASVAERGTVVVAPGKSHEFQLCIRVADTLGTADGKTRERGI